MGTEKIESLEDEDAVELDADEIEREDSALEDLKAVQAAISSEDEDDDDDSLGGMSLGFGAQAAASLSAGDSLSSGPSASLAGPAPAPDDDDAAAAASLAAPSALPASLTAGQAPAAAPSASMSAAAPVPPQQQQQGGTQWGVVAAIVAVALATVGAVGYVAYNPTQPDDEVAAEDGEEGVGRAALAGGAVVAGAANPTSQIQKAARPLGAAPDAEPLAEATKVTEEAEKAALDGLEGGDGLILDDDDGEFEEGDPMHGGADLKRKKRKKVDIEYGIKRNKRDDGKDDEPEEEAAPEPEAEETPAEETPAEDAGPKTPKAEENIDCLLNPGAPGCKTYDAPKETGPTGPALPQKLSQRDIANGLRAPKKSAKQCGVTHNSSEVVRVHVTIAGNGTVQKVTAKGLHKGTPLGTCVENFLSKATFPKFQSPTMGLDISVAM